MILNLFTMGDNVKGSKKGWSQITSTLNSKNQLKIPFAQNQTKILAAQLKKLAINCIVQCSQVSSSTSSKKISSKTVAVTLSSNMAVKKRKLIHDSSQKDLAVMANYLKMLNNHMDYVSPAGMFTNLKEIVTCLAQAQGTVQELSEHLQVVEQYLLQMINTEDDVMRHIILTAIMEKLNQVVTDPNSNAGPATAVVLVVLNSHPLMAQSTAQWIVQLTDGPEGTDGAGLRSALAYFYSWLANCNGMLAFGDWLLAFIKILEEKDRYDILIEVTLEHLGYLFCILADPSSLKQCNVDVVFHLLSSLRESSEAFDVIAPDVHLVLTTLASDSSQFSRQLLQNVVDILTEMVNYLSKANKDVVAFRNKYMNVISYLERHMASLGCNFLQLVPWIVRNAGQSVNTGKRVRKVGLLNLGNTCYMNSVMQALLLTRQFSNHVLLQMNTVPYWSKMGVLFAKLIHSLMDSFDPVDFVRVFRPPTFTSNNQHDSFEFLGYLFELLKSFEQAADVNYNYSRSRNQQLNNGYRLRSLAGPPSGSGNDMENAGTSASRRSVSPRPGSSSGDFGAGSKRSKLELDQAKKRQRTNEACLRRDMFGGAGPYRESVIDSLFSGVLLTRVQCTECHFTSHSRDVFRDLQLGFPERPEEFLYSVQNLLDHYCSTETLTGDNKYQCRECGVLREAERSVLIETPPKYLILVLKYFKYDPKLKIQTKLMHNTYHNFTILLPTVRAETPTTYVLYAAVVHSGSTLDSGHYYTLGKDKDAWYSFNDEIITNITDSEINMQNTCCTPYVLFYRRTDIDEGTAPALEDLPPKLQEQVMSHNKEAVDNARMQYRIGA